MAKDDGNGWSKWEEHVLAELNRHDKWLANISHVQSETLIAIAGLKARSGVWGALAGLATAATALGIAVAVWLIRGN